MDKYWIFFLLLAFGLTACGQKGDLVHPSSDTTYQQEK